MTEFNAVSTEELAKVEGGNWFDGVVAAVTVTTGAIGWVAANAALQATVNAASK